MRENGMEPRTNAAKARRIVAAVSVIYRSCPIIYLAYLGIT
jgi:hypothetical protein